MNKTTQFTKLSLLTILMVTSLLLFLPKLKAQPRDSVEGLHYSKLEVPLSVSTPDDVIEVREFFWYGCASCFTLEPLTTAYRDGVRGDVRLIRTPVVWNDLMLMHAKLYYVARYLKIEDKIHSAAFKSVHSRNDSLSSLEAIQQLFADNGITEVDFFKAWSSPEVSEQVFKANADSLAADFRTLPAMLVNGEYLVVENESVFNHVELNIAVNLVIKRLREQRRKDF
jgi:thiol:disulfide interchange protein DsbA